MVVQPGQANRPHGCTQRGGRGLFQGDQCPGRVVAQAEHRDGRRLQGDRDREGLVVVEHQRWEGVPCAEPVPAAGSVDGGHRIVEPAQGLDVAPDGALTDPERGSELVQWPLAARSEQGQQP